MDVVINANEYDCKRPKLKIPLPDDPVIREAIYEKYFATEEWEINLDKRTAELKRMANYCGLNFTELEDLPLSTYLLIRRDSWIDSMQQTEEAKEVLKNIIRLGRKDADKNLKRG